LSVIRTLAHKLGDHAAVVVSFRSFSKQLSAQSISSQTDVTTTGARRKISKKDDTKQLWSYTTPHNNTKHTRPQARRPATVVLSTNGVSSTVYRPDGAVHRRQATPTRSPTLLLTAALTTNRPAVRTGVRPNLTKISTER